MSYLHRLAHRIARFRTPALAFAALVAACSQGDRVDFLSPFANPNKAVLASVRIEPRIAAAPLGSEFVFTARGLSQSGEVVPAVFEWSAEGGNISPEGRYIGSATGPFQVIVRAHQNPALADTAVIAVWQSSTDPIGLVVQPDSLTIEEGDTLSFRASLSLADGMLAEGATVNWSTSGGEIDNSGRFNSFSAGTYTVAATTTSGLKGNATVFVRRRNAKLTRIVLEPDSARLALGQGLQFTAIGTWNSGQSGPVPAEWSATGGTISSGGAYTAANQAGVVQVVARAMQGGLADTAVVSVASLAPTLVSLTIDPKSVSMPVGKNQQFSVSGSLSDGTTTTPLVSWSATGGNVTTAGLYTGGSTAGTYRVIAVQQGGSRTDTAVVTLTPPPPPSLTALGISPKDVTLPTGATQQYGVSVVWSDGTTVPPQVTWTATGGSITSSGFYTAGSTAGTYRVIVSGGGRADTTSVTIAYPPPPPSSVGCSDSNPGWIWCDDFEQNRLTSYFEYDNNSGDFVRMAGVGYSGSVGMRVRWQPGEVGAGNLKLAFGRTPTSYMRPVDAGTANYRELYWRMQVRNQAGWIGGGADKLSRAAIMAGSNWPEAMIAPVWSGGAGGNYLLLDPASGTDPAGNLKTTRYNDFANLSWLGETPGQTPLFGAAQVGQWYCVEAHARLNTAGHSDGVFELWINGVLDAQRTGLNWVGSYSAYGINVLFFENYWNNGSPVAQERYFDDIVVSTQRIGCSATSLPPPPSPTLVSLTVNQQSVSLAAGAIQLFTAAALWSDGSTTLPALSWSATGGSISGVGLYTAGATPGTYQVLASGGGRSAIATVAVTSAAQSAAPVVVEDFSTYSSISNFLSDPRGIYAAWRTAGTERMTLDRGVGLNAGGYNLSQSLRYDYTSSAQAGCNNQQARLLLALPSSVTGGGYGTAAGQAVKDLWVEFWMKVTPNFTIRNLPCNPVDAWKSNFISYNLDGYGRAEFQFAESRYGGIDLSGGGIDHPAYRNTFGNPYSEGLLSNDGNSGADGQWHQFRLYYHLDPNNNGTSGARVWVDGVLRYSYFDFTLRFTPGYEFPRPGFLGIHLGDIIVPPLQNQSVWWGRVALYTSNPGW